VGGSTKQKQKQKQGGNSHLCEIGLRKSWKIPTYRHTGLNIGWRGQFLFFLLQSLISTFSFAVSIKSPRIRYGTATPKSREGCRTGLINTIGNAIGQSSIRGSKRARQASRSINAIQSIQASKVIYSAAPNMQFPVS
jgi:hypothetical protein